MRFAIPAIALVLAFVVSTQIALVHHLRGAGLLIAFLLVSLVMLAIDFQIVKRRFGPLGRMGLIFAIFLTVWIGNSISSLTSCNRSTHRCHKVFVMNAL